MALKGTLKDFGIADILQLIGHQLKTGILTLKNKQQEVRVSFVEGNVVKAEMLERGQAELLGGMLVRSEMLSDEQLETALEIQRRTLRKLGDILVDSGYVTQDTIREFTRLQTTETIYKLFNWKSGTYEFEQVEVKYDPQSYESIRSESLLMEGFRMVDEWPLIRRRITSHAMRFEIVKPFPQDAPKKKSADNLEEEFLSGLDAAFDGGSAAGDKKGKKVELGENERWVYSLIKPDRDVQKIIELSRLGEFETCKSLCNMLEARLLAAVPPKRKAARGRAEPGGQGSTPASGGPSHLVPLLVRSVTTAVLASLCVLLVRVAGVEGHLLGGSGRLALQTVPIEEGLSWRTEARIHQALQIYYMENLHYPERLEQLLDVGLLSAAELRYPWRDVFAFRLTESGYELRRPLR